MNKQISINKMGGGKSEESELAKPCNVLIKGRLSLFAGAMTAALFVCTVVGCTPCDDPDTSRSNRSENVISASDSTQNGGLNVGITFDTEYEDTIHHEF